MVRLKGFTIKSNQAIVRSKPKKAISSLSDRGNTAGEGFGLEWLTGLKQEARLWRGIRLAEGQGLTAYVLVGENSSSCLFFVELSQSRMIVLCLGQILPNVRHRASLELFLSPSKEVMHPTAIE